MSLLTSWSKQHTHKFGGSHDELATAADCDKFVESSEENYPGVCDGRSVWMTDCRKLDGTDQDKNPEIHVGRNSKIMTSILGSKDHHERHSHLYVGISRFLSSKNVLIMICENGRRSSVANAELWSSTLSRHGRYLHSVSLIHLSERDFWKDTCGRKCPECSRQSSNTFPKKLRLRSCRMFHEHWKRPRRESHGVVKEARV